MGLESGREKRTDGVSIRLIGCFVGEAAISPGLVTVRGLPMCGEGEVQNPDPPFSVVIWHLPGRRLGPIAGKKGADETAPGHRKDAPLIRSNNIQSRKGKYS